MPHTIDDIVQKTHACILTAKYFFVSWNGVLTLVYSGFPGALVGLKSEISASFPGLKKESPGSLWPKTSLAALKDKKRLTPAQLDKLNKICGALSEKMANLDPAGLKVTIDKLAVVVYECRCLERTISKHVIPLKLPADLSDPDQDQIANVDRVVEESTNPNYWFFASKDGNTESHYRGTGLGATLVHDLACFSGTTNEHQPSHLPGLVRELKQQIEAELPELYSWFLDESLHVTVRGLIW